MGERGGSSINLLTCSLPQQASQKKKYCCLYSLGCDRFTSSFQASHINCALYSHGKGQKKPKMRSWRRSWRNCRNYLNFLIGFLSRVPGLVLLKRVMPNGAQLASMWGVAQEEEAEAEEGVGRTRKLYADLQQVHVTRAKQRRQ